MKIQGLDHLVITATDIEQSVEFYTTVLGMKAIPLGDGRTALGFGNQKINLHKYGAEIKPHARTPLPGSTDICLLTDTPMLQILSHLDSCNISIIEGPVNRTGATGPLLSVYIRDPDGNLLELANRTGE